MTYSALSSLWDDAGNQAILVCPWQIEISNPSNVLPGGTFNVNATITYPNVYPFQAALQTGASSVNAAITLPSGLTLTAGETATQACVAQFEPGQSFTVSWQVNCQALGDYKINVEAEGLVNGSLPPELPAYPQPYTYQDRIGGTNDSTVAATATLDTTPPITTADYDGSWQNQPFTINLTASDDNSGILETHYKINNGPVQTVALNGEPLITTPGASNTLEYWSVDWAGNEELPHKLLTNIKLDETPPSLLELSLSPSSAIQADQAVEVTVSATDDLSGLQNVTLLYSTDNGVSWIYQAMTLNESSLLFDAAIPGQPIGTVVTFYVQAYDQAGNSARLMNGTEDFTYQIPPLMVTDITARAWIYQGQTAYINITISDTGMSPENVRVTVYYNITAGEAVNALPVYLQTGQTYTLLFAWSTASIPCLNYTLTAVATIPAGNATLFGQTITVRIMGDVNGDGRVDMKDIALIARSFGCTSTSPRWNSACDLCGDGVINMKDIALAARNFGKQYR